MRNAVIGMIIGVVLGVVLGATVIAPRLQRGATVVQSPSTTAADLAKQLPRALVARPAVALKLATAFPLETPIVGGLARRIDAQIWDVSRGQIEIRPYPPGALAPVEDLFESLSAGVIDAALFSPGEADAGLPAIRIFAGLPFGPSIEEVLAWMEFGGGRSLLDALTEPRNVHAILCGAMPQPSFGWFRREVMGPSDLRGLKMSVRGVASLALARLGVDVVDLPAGAVMLELEQGTLDAVSWSSPAVDRQAGFAAWLNFYYPKGWGDTPTLLYLMLAGKTWASMNAQQQAQIEAVCGDAVRFSLSEGEASQFAAMKSISADGVRLQRLPPALEETIARTWQAVVQDAVGADADFARVWKSLSAFDAEWSVWRELGRE